MIIYFIIKIHCQTPIPDADFTWRLYSVHAARPKRAHGPLEDPTALPHRCHSVLSNTLCKRQAAACVCSKSKRRRIAFYAIAQRFHSVTGVCTARTSAI